MQPTSLAAMSGGWAVKTKKRGVVRAGAQRLHGPRFLPEGLGLDGQGAACPDFKQMQSAEGCLRTKQWAYQPERSAGQ